MKNTYYLLLIFVLIFSSCKSKKQHHNSTKTQTKTAVSIPVKTNKIIDKALEFEGTKYKYGGTTKKGMDCSGLIYTAFASNGVSIPRTSKAMSMQGETIKLSNVKPGDLLFFKTNKNKNVINHVGLVTETRVGYIQFVHSTTSSGVITSSLAERYWKNTFTQARRIL
ncbi:MAG: hypothetical protein BM564_12755 [Bacteroidetes bacterium MedPE-SWsnd-G2]|nr:MAG: hypothetical protein BM564_12755 [Bacteroidetes bacterium MedPE-SWsnd-G2]